MIYNWSCEIVLYLFSNSYHAVSQKVFLYASCNHLYAFLEQDTAICCLLIYLLNALIFSKINIQVIFVFSVLINRPVAGLWKIVNELILTQKHISYFTYTSVPMFSCQIEND